MNEARKKKAKMLVVALVWCGLLGIVVFGYVKFWKPAAEEQQRIDDKQAHQDLIDNTSSQSRFKHNVVFHLDSFTGYALLRNREIFMNECAKKGIKVFLLDDAANYPGRLQALADGNAQMAVFTWDALWKTSAEMNDLPATIVSLIDETKGADAIVGAKRTFPNLDAINDPDVKIVATLDSPSEFISRVVMHHYNLPLLSKDPFESADGAADVYKRYKKSKVTDKKVFALWEPYVSKILENPEYHVLVSSDKFRGYIVDAIVVNRSFLAKNEQVVEDVIKAYFMAVFKYRHTMEDVVMKDAKQLGEPLTPEQAKALTKGIWWKNTQENFGHFGLTSGHGLQHMEEIGQNIVDVLLKTEAISSDPTDGQPSKLYYDKIMHRLFDESWHPGFGHEVVREEKSLAALSDEEWKSLQPVGTLKVPRLVFARGTDRLTSASEKTMGDLVEKLKTWPQYYLLIRGNCAKSDDPEVQKLNQELAERRAAATKGYLVKKGINRDRIHSESSAPNGSTTVAFLLGELPY